jgi:hypothetical protein
MNWEAGGGSGSAPHLAVDRGCAQGSRYPDMQHRLVVREVHPWQLSGVGGGGGGVI